MSAWGRRVWSGLLTAVLVAATGSGAALPVAAQSAQYKGLPVLSRELGSRIAPPGMTIELDWFLPAPTLADLLGTWSAFGSEHSFQNGAPNALNMTIYHVTLTNFARAMGTWCEAPPLVFEDRFADTLEQLCQWPQAGARDEDTLQAFWLGVMGYAAPRAEYEAWRDFFLGSTTYRDKPARETVSAMALAILMNPYVLLHR